MCSECTAWWSRSGGQRKRKHDGLLLGEAMVFGLNLREFLSGIGIKGEKLPEQQKEAIIASGIPLDYKGNVPQTQSNFMFRRLNLYPNAGTFRSHLIRAWLQSLLMERKRRKPFVWDRQCMDCTRIPLQIIMNNSSYLSATTAYPNNIHPNINHCPYPLQQHGVTTPQQSVTRYPINNRMNADSFDQCGYGQFIRNTSRSKDRPSNSFASHLPRLF